MLEVLDRLSDEVGPEKIVYVHDPSTGLKGVLVIDNTARGIAKGGLRVAPNVTVEIIARLARAMTYKLAMAGIPWGGAKSGIVAEGDAPNKEKLIRGFVRGIREYLPSKYIIGIDMNVTEEEIAKAVDELDSGAIATGKPECMGGIPPYELGITGFGIAEAAEVATTWRKAELAGATAAVQGCGWVGMASASNLAKKGSKVIAVSDSTAAVYDEKGLDVPALVGFKRAGGSFADYSGADKIPLGEELTLPVDVLVLGAKEDVIGPQNMGSVKAKVIVEGANLPVPAEVERELGGSGIVIVPDFVANFGGALAAWTEFACGTEEQAFALTKSRVRKRTEEVLRLADEEKTSTRDASLKLAQSLVFSAMKARGRRS